MPFLELIIYLQQASTHKTQCKSPFPYFTLQFLPFLTNPPLLDLKLTPVCEPVHLHVFLFDDIRCHSHLSVCLCPYHVRSCSLTGEEAAVKHTSSVAVCVRHPAWQTFCVSPLKSSTSQVLCWQLLVELSSLKCSYSCLCMLWLH